MASFNDLNEELPDGYKFTGAEGNMIEEAGGGNTRTANQARMAGDIYAIKVTKMMIDSNKELAKASEKHERNLVILTGFLAFATVVLAMATIFLVIATKQLAP